MKRETLLFGEEILRALEDHTRLRIIRLLLEGCDPCVCELMDSLRLPQHTVSRHLSVLRTANIVRERREGTWRYYYLLPDPDSFTGRVFTVIEKSLSDELLEADMTLFKKRLALRVNGKCVIGSDGQRCCEPDKAGKY